MPFRFGFKIVLYDKEAIHVWGGSLKERWDIPLESQISTVTTFYPNMLIFSIAKLWLPWKHETDIQTMIQ